MDLKFLLENSGLESDDTCLGVEIKSLHHDSRTVEKGGLFFALDGTRKDGAKFIKQALNNGAVCVVRNKGNLIKSNKKSACVYVDVDDVRLVMSLMAKAFHGGYCDKMKTVAVVGTNGKTTIVNMLSQILRDVGTIGTLGIVYGGKRIGHSMTTPDPIDLHRIFKEMYECKVRTVVMEVSAHAIHFRKLAGITFDFGIFTNVTQDHLDFFGTFESYCNTKVDFFIKSAAVKHAVINIDCPAGVRIFLARPKTATTFSLGGNADYSASDLKLLPFCSEFKINNSKNGDSCGAGEDIYLNIPARFNISNAVASFALARELNLAPDTIKKALRTLRLIPGRYNTYRINGFTVIIDYAHTPDGLSKLISSARETMSEKARIITVFGCGGNRDKGKRPLMGKIAAELSDFVVVTSDNPRDEKPLTIMRQIEAGVKPCTAYVMIEDRTSAINFALNMAHAGDIVVVAGKGGEEFQEVGGVFHKYCDEDVVKLFMNRSV